MQTVSIIEAYDAHIHIALDGIDWKSSLSKHSLSPNEDAIRSVLEEYASRDFVYLRDGGDKYGASLLASKIAFEYGIEYATPAFPIFKKGNYGAFIGKPFDSMDDFEHLVDEAIERGASFIKVMLGGIMDFKEFGKLTGYTLEANEITCMAQCVHGKGLSIMAHVNGSEGVTRAIEAGIDSIEHGYYMDLDTQAALAQSDCIWVPTLAPICNAIGSPNLDSSVLERIKESQISAVANVILLGGTVASGSDAGAGSVLHAKGGLDEYGLLRSALGDSCDAATIEGLYALRGKFPGHSLATNCTTCAW